MAEKNIVVSIDDARLKDISEVLANKSCLKILDLFAEKNASVSDVAESLKIPLNTADYNVKKLVKAGLIEKESHWWSVKGKKIPIYKISNKKIIISPKNANKNVLAGILTAGLAGVGALFIKGLVSVENDMALRGFADSSAGVQAVEIASQPGFIEWIINLPAWGWFLAGAWLTLVLFFAIAFVNNKFHGGKK